MAPAPSVGEAFFPLDEELGLLRGGLTPRGEETLVRLSAWMPYAPARELLEDLLGVQVSKATARRATLARGQAALAVWEAEVERLKQETPQAPAGAEKQALSGMERWCIWWEANGRKSRPWLSGRSRATCGVRSAHSTSPTVRVWVMPQALSKQRSSKRIGGD